MVHKSRKEAMADGSGTYFTGSPCKRGHVALRRSDNSTCVECIKERNKEFYAQNRDQEKARSLKYKEENKEKCRQARLRWKSTNPDRVRAHAKNHYRRNREEVLTKNKEYRDRNRDRIALSARSKRKADPEKYKIADAAKYIKHKHKIQARSKIYREKNAERIMDSKRRWMADNPEKVKAARWRRKSLMKNAEGSFSGEDIEKLFSLQRGLCACCNCSISSGYDIDHVNPLSLGGSNNPDNLQLLCPTCNRSKSNKDPYKWANDRGMLL